MRKVSLLLGCVLVVAIWQTTAVAEGLLSVNTEGRWYRPAVGVSWQWQLLVDDEHPLNTAYEAELYNLDLFSTPATTISLLQAAGRRVVCYFSAGTYESYVADRNQFAARDVGQVLADWPDERWLDIRSPAVQRIMTERLDLAASKGCDAVEPDNVQGYLEDTGFALSAEHQLAYNRFIATEAHRRGLAVGLKNSLEQVAELVDYFDFSINEQCFQYKECQPLLAFIEAGKPVLNVEYPDQHLALDAHWVATLCAAANARQFSTLILPVELDDRFRIACADAASR
ncbi:hypothetical protein SAMN05216271_0194 [Halopseudomonas sabulinigri]|uniref:Glycoside-hydrolase family GH114 TIM-barrel domain-containing protein n=1 Tax=Halopseudomonas sabulinigri TaxID=472181 RepID=A0A1H1LEI7_9GAMM|nr:endo alpha-1,4 polygalactosaminidase [Halopseudomonas sabulinigri]SDR72938.1 hypothetical protein SAMN05216271_0194 [Halopseudomonas sabulinigri]